MPRSISPNKQNTESRILDAAAQLFSRQGFHGTSTREIARLADINEATLFRYFASKEALFWAALDSRIESLRIRRELKAALASDDPPETVVPMLIEFLVHVALYQPELTRLLYFSLLEMEPAAERVYRYQVGPVFGSVRDYLTRCVRQKRLRPLDASVGTIALVSTVLAHMGLYRALTGDPVPFCNADKGIEAYSKFWLSALLPNPSMIALDSIAETSSS